MRSFCGSNMSSSWTLNLFLHVDGFLDIKLHPQHGAAQRLALCVVLQRLCSSAPESLVQQKIHRPQIRELEPLDLAKNNAFEVLLHALRRKIFHQQRVVLLSAGDNADIARITLVARTSMSNVDQANSHLRFFFSERLFFLISAA